MIAELIAEIAQEVIVEEEEREREKIPQLPTEIINMIFYKFGGLQHPIVKDMKQLKSKVEYAKQHTQDLYEKGEIEKWKMFDKTFEVFEKGDLPLRNIKRFDDSWHDGLIEFDKLTRKSYDFVFNLYWNVGGKLNKSYYWMNRSFKDSNRKKEEDSVKIKEHEHTYLNSSYIDGWSMEVEIDNKDRNIPYSRGTLKEVQEYYGRHLINKNMTAKQMREHLHNNGHTTLKSWKKDKLLKLCYLF
jgi:hypothetical protein